MLLALAPVFCLAVQGRERASTSSDGKARVLIVKDANATEAFKPHAEIVRAMVNHGITNLTGAGTVSNAWRSLVSTNDVVGIKVYSLPGPNSGTRPAVVEGVLQGLLSAGISPRKVVIWDKEASDLKAAGFFELAKRYNVRVAGSAQAGYDLQTFYESAIIGNLVFGDLEFRKTGPGIGRKSFVSKLAAREITKIINVTPMLNHNLAGVSGTLYGLAVGSVDNVVRFESDPDRLAVAVPEIYALPCLTEHVALNIVDALICQYEGGERGLLHYSTMLNQLRFSLDPVALDVLSVQELDTQRQAAKAPPATPDFTLYNNASLLELGVSDPKKIQIEPAK